MKKIKLLCFCIFGLILTKVSSNNRIPQKENISCEKLFNAKKIFVENLNTNTPEIDSIIDFGKTFLNKPYRYKGPSSWEMDCAGYIAFIFSKFGYEIPHSSISIGEIVKNIELTEIKKGDLMFFKGRNIKSNTIGHVSIVVEVENGNIKMMHSCSRGIIIEDYQNSDYYKQRFIKAGELSFVNRTTIDW